MNAGRSTARSNPYTGLPASRYWRSAVAERHPMDMDELYTPKFPIARTDRIAVAGSCFAQHVGHNLKARGFTVLDEERAPEVLDDDVARHYGYNIYSARYGNIYSARQLAQLVDDSSKGTIREEDFWVEDGRVFDALRPGVEPGGLDSLDEAIIHRRQHLAAVKKLFGSTDVMIFTLGLTEAWFNRRTGTVYPTCPGVIAGAYDDAQFGFVNFDFDDVMRDMVQARAALKAINPNMKFLLTVSPVPLTATASGQNVLVATTYSKSVLRAACGSLYAKFEDVDYFPSYEIIASPAARGFFYEPNMRSINRNGVAHVMATFLKAHDATGAAPAPLAETGKAKAAADGVAVAKQKKRTAEDVVCEDALLEAFAK